MDVVPEDLSLLKVAELRDVCSKLGLSKTGTKKELIVRINEATESEEAKKDGRSEEADDFTSIENGVSGESDFTMDSAVVLGNDPVTISPSNDAELTAEPISDDLPARTTEVPQENFMDREQNAQAAGVDEAPEEPEMPMLDLDVDAEDEIFLDDTGNSDELTVNIEHPAEENVQSTAPETPTAEDGEVITPRSAVTSDKDRSRDDGEIDDDDNNDIDNESLERERECKRKREKSGSKDSDREQSEKLDAQSTPSQPQEKEDTSRQVEGTVQKTVVVPAQGDRPSFDIKIVNPVRSTSKPVKIRKRHEAPEAGKEEIEKKSSGSKDKKRKWATGSSSGGGTLSGASATSNDPSQNASNIVISTDVLNNIVSSKSGSSEKKGDDERENRKSKKSKSRSSGHRHDSAERSLSKPRTSESTVKDDKDLAVDMSDETTQNTEEGASPPSPTPKKGLGKDKERSDGEKSSHSGVKGKESKEEDLEEGEHKAKHAQISFSDVDSSQGLKTVKVKGKSAEEVTATPDTSASADVNEEVEKAKSQPAITLGPLPKREPEQEVPPARNPVSTIVHVMRLTRPFTEVTLKAMLANFGEMVQEEFWIDDIKSQCYVKFKQEDSAKQCREALFGCKWPSTNPKTLKLEFVSQIQLDDVRGILKKITKRRSDSGERFGWNGRVEHLGRSSGDKSGPGGRKSPNIIRTAAGLESRSRRTKEWKRRSRSDSHESFSDYPIGNKMAKVDQHSPSRGGHPQEKSRRPDARDDIGKSSARREQEMRDRYQDRMEQKRKEEEERLRKEREQKEKAAPVKLLDDLFRKTKADPCIYWLPLTTEDEMVARDRKRAAEKLQNPTGIVPEQMSPEHHRKRRGSSSSGSPSPAKRGGGYGGDYHGKPPRRDYASPPGGSQRYPTGAGSGYRSRKGQSPPFYGRSGGRPSNSGGYRPSGGGSSRPQHRDHHSGRYR